MIQKKAGHPEDQENSPGLGGLGKCTEKLFFKANGDQHQPHLGGMHRLSLACCWEQMRPPDKPSHSQEHGVPVMFGTLTAARYA